MHPAPASVQFWSWQLILALALNGFVQCLLIGAYAARLAGALSGRVATAISLFNLFVTVSRMASLFYTPILGSLSDHAAAHAALSDPLRAQAVFDYQWQLRGIVFVGTIGAGIGTLLLPTFVGLFLRGIAGFERSRSLPKTLARLLLPRTALSVLKSVRRPSLQSLRSLSLRHIPKDLLLFNVLVTGVYAIGVVGAAYASVINPDAARTALLSSGLINGVATISFTLIVDPGSAIIVDEAVKGERSINDVKSLVTCLALTTIIGMLMSQMLLVPAAIAVADLAHLITGR